MRILLAEDEKALSKAVVKIFEKNNYSVDAVYDGEDALTYLETGCYDAAVLDIMMPKMDGITVLKKIRASGNQIPVLMLTAKSDIEDKVMGLDSGANDYLPKPFAMGELLARVRAMLRRREDFTPDVLSCGDLTLNTSNAELHCGAEHVVLPKLEFQLMELLMRNRGICLSTEDMLTKVWGYDTEADIGVVWVYIFYLRKRLAGLGSKVEIRARRSVGYLLEESK